MITVHHMLLWACNSWINLWALSSLWSSVPGLNYSCRYCWVYFFVIYVMQTFACWQQPLRDMHTASASDTKRPVMHQGKLSYCSITKRVPFEKHVTEQRYVMSWDLSYTKNTYRPHEFPFFKFFNTKSCSSRRNDGIISKPECLGVSL